MSYLNPLAHIPILEEFLPIFSNAVPKRVRLPTSLSGIHGNGLTSTRLLVR